MTAMNMLPKIGMAKHVFMPLRREEVEEAYRKKKRSGDDSEEQEFVPKRKKRWFRFGGPGRCLMTPRGGLLPFPLFQCSGIR